MKKRILLIGFSFLLMAADCDFDKDHHWEITIENRSKVDFYFAYKFFSTQRQCILDLALEPILQGDEFIFRPFNLPIEREISTENPYEFFLVDVDKHNERGVFYDCDSISIKNNILKHYVLTLKDLEELDFKIVYTGD